MQIKQKRQVNLPQLIEWAWDNEAEGTFKSINKAASIVFVDGGAIDLHASQGCLHGRVLFEIEEEVEVDERTLLRLTAVTCRMRDSAPGGLYVGSCRGDNIHGILNANEAEGIDTVTIQAVHEDGTMTLLWKDGRMVE